MRIKIHGQSISALIILLLLLVMVVLSGCGNTDSKVSDKNAKTNNEQVSDKGAKTNNEQSGVFADKVVLGAHMGISGPAALICEQILAGYQTAIKQINDKGGINGRKFELKVEDDNYNPAQALAAAKKLIDRDHVFAITGAGLAAVMGPLEYINQSKVPYLFPMAGQHQMLNSKAGKELPYVFLTDPDYSTQAFLMTKYLVETKGFKKFAIIYQNDYAGEDFRAGLARAKSELGIQVVTEQGFETTSTDFSAQVQKLKSAGPEAVVLGTSIKQSAMILKEADKQGFKAVYFGNNALVDPGFIKLLGPLAEGNFAANFVLPVDSTDPNVTEFATQFKKYFPDKNGSALTMYGYSTMMLIGEAIEQAGPDLTTEGLMKVIEGWQDHQTKLLGKVSFGPGAHDGLKTVYPMEVKNGKWVKAGDLLK